MSVGLRQDGRRWKELRRLSCEYGTVSSADGSCTFTMGRTKVMAAVFGPQTRSGSNRGASGSHSIPAVELKVSWAPFATQERRERGRTDRFIVELENMLKSTVESMLNFTQSFQGGSGGGFGNNTVVGIGSSQSSSEVQVKVLILEADGGVRSCCFNAVTCAAAVANLTLGDLVVACGCTPRAFGKTLRESQKTSDAMQVGTARMLLDPNSLEISKFGELTLTTTVSGDQQVVSCLCDSKMQPEDLEECVETCAQGCKTIGNFVRKSIMEYMGKVASVSMH